MENSTLCPETAAVAAVAAALTLGSLGVGWGIWSLVGTTRGAPPPARAAEVAANVAPAGTETVESPLPLDPAALYDSLFAARDSSLVGLASRVAGQGAAPGVVAALNAWSQGDASADGVVHNAFVQYGLRQGVDSTVSIDGAILRTPACRGHSCTALIGHWRSRAGEAGYPDPGSAPEADSTGLGVVERLLILSLVAVP